MIYILQLFLIFDFLIDYINKREKFLNFDNDFRNKNVDKLLEN